MWNMFDLLAILQIVCANCVLLITLMFRRHITQVMTQFRDLYERNAIEDAYVMGHRLINFLTAVQKHPSYRSALPQGKGTEQNLSWIHEKMRHIAFLIDEEQLNLYITNDFDPDIHDDEDDEPTDHGSEIPSTQSEWEDFAGWSLSSSFTKHDRADTSGTLDTDESSQDVDEDQFAGLIVRKLPEVDLEEDNYIDKDPELERISDEDHDDQNDYVGDYEQDDYGGKFVYEVQTPAFASSFLKKIARERVRYETDSEAADSWAQSNDDGAVSETTSSATGAEALSMSCDPARIAFREIMNRHSEQLLLLQLEVDRLQNDSPTSPPLTNHCVVQSSHAPLTSSSQTCLLERQQQLEHQNRLQEEHQSCDSPPPPPPPPTNSPVELDGARKQQPQVSGSRFIGFSTHASIRQVV
jgi:hypothetical protein